jgi:uncharacterized protein
MSNRLAQQTSPYLALHAHDPVDWYPWGEEAFALARETRKPIFLSVGYASCHWCHVMHRESFKDPATARVLNDRFVSIKVDRESRPDVDEVYMAYVVAANGHGGWPMSVFLTPELIPVVGGTYFPPVRAYGVPAFSEVLEQVHRAFTQRGDEVADGSQEALGYLRAMFAPVKPSHIAMEPIEKTARALIASVDPQHGGFGGAPKFPQAPVTDFLLDYHRATGNERALDAVESTMECMVRGGIYDQAGGGISRYATDAAWLIPHFEKMLYDNGMLLTTLAALHHLRPRDEWAYAIRQTAEFLQRDLSTPSGALASSLSADTEGEEGKTYVWSFEELAGLLGEQELALAEECLSVTRAGNWEDVNILTRPDGRDGRSEQVDRLLARLFEERRKRTQPDRDDKVIVSWNALAARGLMAGGIAIGDESIANRGVHLTRALLDQAVDANDGVVRIVGADDGIRLLEDAAGLAVACLDAWRLSGDDKLLAAAGRLMQKARDRFYDGDGTWYMTPEDTELPVRPREQHDSPLPSGPSLAALASLQLALATGDDIHRQAAEKTLARLISLAERSPFAAGTALSAALGLAMSEVGTG